MQVFFDDKYGTALCGSYAARELADFIARKDPRDGTSAGHRGRRFLHDPMGALVQERPPGCVIANETNSFETFSAVSRCDGEPLVIETAKKELEHIKRQSVV